MMCRYLHKEVGLPSTTGGRMLEHCAEELRVLSQQEGDHAQAIDALNRQLAVWMYEEEGWSLTGDEEDAEEVEHV